MPDNTEKLLKQARRAIGLKKVRSRLDQAMEEMLRLHELGGVPIELVSQLRAIWDTVYRLELESRPPK